MSNSPQKRHPERSASQIYRVTQLDGAESKDPGDAYLTHAVRTFSTTEVRTGGAATVFSWGREQELLASCYFWRLHLRSGQPYSLHWRRQQPVSALIQHKEGTLEGFTASTTR
jgi:hypothetical protein